MSFVAVLTGKVPLLQADIFTQQVLQECQLAGAAAMVPMLWRHSKVLLSLPSHQWLAHCYTPPDLQTLGLPTESFLSTLQQLRVGLI